MATRKYRSKLREGQARDTRRRILEGAGRVTLFDVHRVTHAAVAKSAGVAERTVFRHFPTVAALHDAFAKFQEQRFGRDGAEEYSLGELPAMYERWPERLAKTEALDYLVREQREPPVVTRSRRQRYARLERAIAPLVPGATRTQIRQLVLVFGALISPEVFRRGKVLLKLDPAEVAPGPAWALRVLIERLQKGDKPWK